MTQYNVCIYAIGSKYHVVIQTNQKENDRVFFIGQLEKAYEKAFEAVHLVRQNSSN